MTTRDCRTNVKVRRRSGQQHRIALSDVMNSRVAALVSLTIHYTVTSCVCVLRPASVQAADRRAAGCSGEDGSLQRGPGGWGGAGHGQEEAKNQIQHLVRTNECLLKLENLPLSTVFQTI